MTVSACFHVSYSSIVANKFVRSLHEYVGMEVVRMSLQLLSKYLSVKKKMRPF